MSRIVVNSTHIALPIVGKDFRGRKIILTEDRWKHIIFKHPEVGNNPAILFSCLKNFAEVYMDQRNVLHALLRQGKRFLLVIYASEDEGYIRISYVINESRKKRRYGKLHRLRLS